jgi:hypothetical protein
VSKRTGKRKQRRIVSPNALNRELLGAVEKHRRTAENGTDVSNPLLERVE